MIMGSCKIVLKCMDGSEFEVSKAIASEMQTIKPMITDDNPMQAISVPVQLKAPVLTKLLHYCEHYALDDNNLNLKSFNDDFLKLHHSVVLDLIGGARLLGIAGLLDLLCQGAADMIKGMSVEEIREMFNMKNDLTPEEEEEIRNDAPWAFE